MSANELLNEFERLPGHEQDELFSQLVRKIMIRRGTSDRSLIGKKLSFDEACEVVFRENRELLGLLAK